MTQDEIIWQNEVLEMVRQAGFFVGLDEQTFFSGYKKEFEAFAKLVAAKEREACALIGDHSHDEGANCGDEIRERGAA
jgi:hypothetical protein